MHALPDLLHLVAGTHGRRVALMWAATLLVIGTRVYLCPQASTTYPIFAHAGVNWTEARALYILGDHNDGLDQFRYAPIVAVSFIPWSLLPDALGGVGWRWLSAAILCGGFYAFYRTLLPRVAGLSDLAVGLLWLLLLPLSLSSLNNGQVNTIVMGLLLCGCVAAALERWNLAALCLVAPAFYKIYPLALGLLLVLVYPKKLGWRLGLMLAAGLLLPFALQDPAYVVREYRAWFDALVEDDRRLRPLAFCYRDFYLLLRIGGLEMLPRHYAFVQLGMGAGMAGLVLLGQGQGCSKKDLVRIAFDLGCCWMILFGPATENCTYVLIGPTLALAAGEAWQPDRPVWTRWLIAGIVALFVGSTIGTAVPGGRLVVYALNPLAALLLFAERLVHLPWRPRRAAAASAALAPPTAQAA